jgi:hypothetical protein
MLRLWIRLRLRIRLRVRLLLHIRLRLHWRLHHSGVLQLLLLRLHVLRHFENVADDCHSFAK